MISCILNLYWIKQLTSMSPDAAAVQREFISEFFKLCFEGEVRDIMYNLFINGRG